MLPAVQAAREAARRMQCTNNLKQLALGCHNYHDVQTTFPGGSVYMRPGVGTDHTVPANWRTPWSVALLPYIEQQSLWDIYCPKVGMDNNTADTSIGNQGKNRELGQANITAFNCPSDALAGTKFTSTYSTMEFRRASYKCIGGRVGSWANWYWEQGGHATLPNYRGIMHLVGRCTNGGTSDLIFENFASITDGTSNTSMISERATPPDYDSGVTAWSGVIPHYQIATIAGYSPTFQATRSHDKCKTMFAAVAAGGMDANTTGSWTCSRSLGSWHSGGVNTALGDASVRFVSETTNAEIWAGCATIQNGEQTALP